ncbi:hypothetical protein [uncultured Prevotella sp.]|uniref:tetratricopeptide repeat protein n=1 Tax=uncultured Prevotella sp. TaxID=159272 RepID=UPI0026127BE4|nr:hypothetical protein [uncultured Prevotella sp.]
MRQFILFFAIFISIAVFSQKKEISEARSNIKSRSNLEKAESSMRNLLKDSANRQNIKIYETLADAVRTQYEVANEKLYLKEQYDTVSFFNTAYRMFLAYESLDSIDALPDKKGRVKPKLRKKNSVYLDKYRRNLYNGGLFFVQKKNYSSAYDLMDTYLDCAQQPLFTDNKYVNNDNVASSAAFWTLLSGYKLNRADSALKHLNLALTNKPYRRRTLQYLSEIYLMKGDTLKYIETLRLGFDENKKSKFFFLRLMDYYNGKNLLDSALNIADTALASDKDNILFLFAKSNILLNMGKYSDCIVICDTILNKNNTLAEVYYNAGISYLNLAIGLEKSAASKRKNRTKILDYYKKSLPYMEKFRELRPNDKEKWASSLYNIYLKLNMGRQFEEMNSILQELHGK